MNQSEQAARNRHLRRLVEEHRAALQARVRDAIHDGQFGTSAPRDAVLDDGEASQSEHEADIFFSMLELASGHLADGEAALRRFQEGCYGVCERCGEPISEGRLLAMPFARRCTPCEDERDRGGAARGWDSRVAGGRWSHR